MKTMIDVPQSLVDEAAQKEIKELRKKNAKLFSQVQALQHTVRVQAAKEQDYDTARSMVRDLADLFDIQR